MSFLTKLLKDHTEDYVFYRLTENQVPEDIRIAQSTVTADKAYLNIFLKSFRVVDVRKGLDKFYPVVHSKVTMSVDGKPRDFGTVTSPTDLKDIPARNLDRIMVINKRLLGPIAYRGGDIDFDLCLLSVQSENLAKPFIGLLTQLSDVAGVAFVKQALPFVEPLKKGIDALVGIDEKIIESGVNVLFDAPVTGYYVVMRAPKDAVTLASLSLDKDDFKLKSANNSVKDYPYLIFSIETTNENSDWRSVPGLFELYDKLKVDTRAGDYEAAKVSLALLKRTLLTSDELLQQDAQLIYDKIYAQFAPLLGATVAARGAQRVNEFPELAEINIDFKR